MGRAEGQPTVFISEADVSEQWPILPQRDLKRARRKREIAFYQSPIGPHYRADDVEAFIERKYRQCPAGEPSPQRQQQHAPMPVGSMEDITLINLTPSEEGPGTPANTMPASERFAAGVLAQEILGRPKRHLSKSHQSPPSPLRKHQAHPAS
jgi:hypothetical protein